MMTFDEQLRTVNDYVDTAPLPIQMVPLARQLGVRVYKAAWSDDISGLIKRDEQHGGESGYAIFVNQSHHINRRRFTIAHELSHYLLHRDQIGDGLYDDALYRSGLTNKAERQANQMAANLLMPMSRLQQRVKILGYDVDKLAKEFGVSKQAMSIRLGEPYVTPFIVDDRLEPA